MKMCEFVCVNWIYLARDRYVLIAVNFMLYKTQGTSFAAVRLSACC